MQKIIWIALLGLLTFGCATQMVEKDANDSCAREGKKAFVFDAKQKGIPLLLESASAMVLCVGPDDITHLPDSFGADAISTSNFNGAGIVSVSPGSVAAKAAIMPGDIVTEFAGRPIANARELQSYIERMSPGEQSAIKLRRKGKDTLVTAQF